jgi:hypothetical protein
VNRKNFLKSCGIFAAAAFIPFNKNEIIGKTFLNPGEAAWLNVEHTFDKYNSIIKCPAIKEKIKIFHISDSHLSILENGKSECPEYTSRMDSAYKNSKHYLAGKDHWPESGNQKTTYEFLIEILSCRNLLAIFAWHDHSAKQNRISASAYQYLAQSANTGAYRYIESKNSL